MERWIRGLSTFAGVCRDDVSELRVHEQSLDDNYTELKHEVKLTIRGLMKPPDRPSRHIEPARARARPLPPLRESVAPRPAPLLPAPFPVRHYSMRVQPCRAAVRIFRPKARERLREDRLEVIDDYLQYPTAEGAERLDGRIDPILRVGRFNPNEMKWNGTVPTNVW
jgi:hypothetical protein